MASLFLVVVTTLLLLRVWESQAWIAEDAHITLRTVLNFVSGYGLRWNVDERVQTFTHPLWLLVILPIYSVTREFYTTVSSIGLAFSLGAYAVVCWHFRHRPVLVLTLLFLPCLTSVFLVRYSTSGLENPLTCFLLAIFAVTVLGDHSEGVPWFRVGLLAGLAGLNRLDTIVLVLPAVGLLVLQHRRSVSWRRLVLGFTPLMGWLLFAFLYYGFLLPNTAYGKLSPGIPRNLYLLNGARFLADPWINDPISAAALLAGTAVSGVCAFAWLRDRNPRAGLVAAIGIGPLLYSLYIVWIGGDFMSGRFWAAPVFVSLIVVLAGFDQVVTYARFAGPMVTTAVCILLVLLGVGSRSAALSIEGEMEVSELPIRALPKAGGGWTLTRAGRHLRGKARRARRRFEHGGPQVQVFGAIGVTGLAVGHGITIIDTNGLGDPLMARLAPAPAESFMPGHYHRDVPAGYRHARETGSLERMHPALAEYYSRLRTITSAPLTSFDRLAIIVRFNLGSYGHLLAEYEASDE